jgi:hypothetical protein
MVEKFEKKFLGTWWVKQCPDPIIGRPAVTVYRIFHGG